MANLKELRTRIASVKSTKQMTSAMKMVAASKLRKAQNAAVQLEPYANKLKDILSDLFASANEDLENKLMEQRKVKNVLIISITSNRGLCGAFNSNIEKETISTIKTYSENNIKSDNINLYCFGKKGADSLKRRDCNIIKSNTGIFDNLNYEYVKQIGKDILEGYVAGDYDKIEIIYNYFKNAGTQIVTKEQLLPIIKPQNSIVKTNYIYEPNHEELLEQLIPRFVTIQLYKTILSSYAAEHGARMTAMHKATDNASELLKDLTLNYNKARQAAITNEILEIVGGAEALNS